MLLGQGTHAVLMTSVGLLRAEVLILIQVALLAART